MEDSTSHRSERTRKQKEKRKERDTVGFGSTWRLESMGRLVSTLEFVENRDEKEQNGRIIIRL